MGNSATMPNNPGVVQRTRKGSPIISKSQIETKRPLAPVLNSSNIDLQAHETGRSKGFRNRYIYYLILTY